VGAYFSSQSSTLPAAAATGRFELRANALVERLDYDAGTGRVSGVRVIDTQTGARETLTARVVFLCASAIASAQIMLNSRSTTFPDGLANDSGALGRHLMDHCFQAGALGVMPGFEQYTTYGARPNGIYVPRFRNLGAGDDLPFVRGYGYQGGAQRLSWQAMAGRVPGFGAAWKQALSEPGPWVMSLGGFGECLPAAGNRMVLDERAVDRFGVPQIRFEFRWGDNERRMRADMAREARSMLEAAGAVDIREYDNDAPGGLAIHEMGTARMGRDPATSVLNGRNQAHAVANLFVTDGACMTSSSCVNPSVTYMALTARAAEYAAALVRDGAL
jgi:choline dehydrogenase-like flavoprotein